MKTYFDQDFNDYIFSYLLFPTYWWNTWLVNQKY